MRFGITEKPTMHCVSLYNNAGLISKVSEKIATENAENCCCRQSHCHLTPLPGNPSEYPHKPYIARKKSQWPTFLSLIVWVYRHLNSCGGLRNTHLFIFFAIECVSAVQGHPRSLILAPIERTYATSY